MTQRSCPTRRRVRPKAGGASQSMPALPPGGLARTSGYARARPYRGDEPRLLQDTDVLLHVREAYTKLLGKVGYRSVRTPEPLQNATSGGVRERGERRIWAGSLKLNHSVQYRTRIGGAQGEAELGLHSPIQLHAQGRTEGRTKQAPWTGAYLLACHSSTISAETGPTEAPATPSASCIASSVTPLVSGTIVRTQMSCSTIMLQKNRKTMPGAK